MQISNVRVFKLLTGESIIGELVGDSDLLIHVQSPFSIGMIRGTDGPELGFSEWILASEPEQLVYFYLTALASAPINVIEEVAIGYQKALAKIIVPEVSSIILPR